MVIVAGTSILDVIRVIINIGVIWLLFFFAVKLLCMAFPRLLEFINNNSIIVSVFQVSWKTQYYNDKIYRLYRKFPRFFSVWFGMGMIVTLVVVPVSFGLFVYNLFILLVQPVNVAPPIVPIVPGVTVQARDSIYLFIALLLCMIFHELGHALASFTHDTRIQNVGLFIVFIFPAAHVTIDTDAIYRLRLWQRLQVFTAGVWHNIALALVFYLLIYSQPFLLSPLYHYSSSELYITKIPSNSILSKSLEVGDRMVSLNNNCNIRNPIDYMKCIQQEIDYPSSYCLNEKSTILCLNTKIQSFDNNFRECFSLNDLQSMKKCQILNTGSTSGTNNSSECNKESRCIDLSKIGYRYFELIVQSQDPKYQSANESIPFIGTPMELWTSFRVDRYRARFRFLESFDLPYHLNQFYQYVIQLSLGIAVFNAVPIHALDGEYILEGIFHYLFPKPDSLKRRPPLIDKARKLILNISLVLLVLNIILSYFQLFK